MTTSPGSEPVCGESYDHQLRLIDERDGYAAYECIECGAEILTEPDVDSNEDDEGGQQ
jgi:hypothetical protein